MITRKFLLSAIAIAALLITGCDKSSDSGRLVIKLTDAPFPIEMISEANVTITKIEARRTDIEDEQYPFILLSDIEATFNLLDLQNGVTATLLDMEIESGTYDLIRLYTGDASVVMTNGDVYEMKVPSGPQTGIKLKIDPPLEIAGGLSEELILDFDLSKSFVMKGNYATPAGILGFNFKPVIRVANSATAGRIAGHVTDTASVVLENAEVWIAQDTVVATAFTDEAGFYSIIGIPAGDYYLSAYTAGFDTLTTDITVTAGNLKVADLKLTPEGE
ncbi:MAG: DUF4382 domain-containing protein [Bacteroidales bacterium]